MSVESTVRAVTTYRLTEMKQRGEKIAMLTSYDYSMARIVDAAGIDVILVGDSAANVMAGYETTVPITLDMMIYHARSVVRAVERALVVVDLPFGTYQGNSKMALDSAIRIMKETEADAVKLEKWGTFWLSDTPDVPSVGWDASTYRTATWALFTHYKSGRKFFYVNTHIDHVGQVAAQKSMELIEAKIRSLNPDNQPTVLTADFNKMLDSPIFDGVKKFMADARTTAPVTDNKASFNNFGGATNYPRIDHIFSSGFTPLRFATVDQRYEKVPYISDHYPIAAVLEFK